MEFFPNINRTLARIRCLSDSLKCIENNDLLPESLCYIPNYFVYQVNSSIKSNWHTVKLQFYTQPCISDANCHKLLNVNKQDGLIFVESEPVTNEDGYWLKVFKVIPSKSKNKKFKFKPVTFYLLQSATSLDIPKLQLIDYKMPSDGRACWRGKEILVTSWEQVVEIWYGVTIVSHTLAKYTVEPNEDFVNCMRAKPSSHWDELHDEQLVKFLSEHPDDNNRKAGTVWAYVNKIELSSCLDSHEDSVAALTDDNHNTYWESDGSQSLHYILLHMKKGAVVEKMFLDVDPIDDSYMPHKIEIYGSSTKLHETELENNQTGEICVFESASQFYPTIEIRIVECKEDGVDTRIRGLKIRTKNFSPTDLSEKYFSSSYLVQYPLLSSVPAKSLYWRAVAIKRLITLLDSVLVYLVPKYETDVKDDFFRLLNKTRFLFPLSKRRKTLFDSFVKETERLKSSSSIPKLFVNRRQASENRGNAGLSVFCQIFEGLKFAHRSESALNYRFSAKVEQWWECKFIGEGVIDQGGGFRDSLCDVADELCPLEIDIVARLPYFVKAANQFEDKCIRDIFVVNPSCSEFEAYEWIGKIIGACLRTKEKLVLSLSKFTWKRLLGLCVTFEDDFNTVDHALVSFVDKLKNMSEENFYHYFGHDHCFTCVLSDGSEQELYEGSANKRLTFDNRMEYAERIKKIQSIRNGLLKVIPWAALQLITWQEFETYVCGNPEISLEALKGSARYEDIEPSEKRVQYLWEALNNFTNDERSKFLRFVTGRRRLPTPLFICPDKGDDSLTSNSLPESSTCSNTLFLPNYTSAAACEEKLRYAIFNCLAIDTDMSPWDE